MGENYGCGGYWNPAPPRNDPRVIYGGSDFRGYYQQRPAVFADVAYYCGAAPDNLTGIPTAMPAAPAAPAKPATPTAPSKPTTSAGPAKPAVPAASKTKAPKKPETPKAPATSKLPATKLPAVTKPDPSKTPAQPATPKAPEQPAVPAVTQPKVSAVPCRKCQQQARHYNLRLNSGTPGCKECEYLAAFLSYHASYPTTEIPSQQVLKYNAVPRAEGRERTSRGREGRGKEVRNATRNEVSKKLPAQGGGKNSRAQEKEVFRVDEGNEVRNIDSKKKSKKTPFQSRGRHFYMDGGGIWEGEASEVPDIANKKKSPFQRRGRHLYPEDFASEGEGLGGEEDSEVSDTYIASRKSKGGFYFCCTKIPDEDDEEEGKESDEKESYSHKREENPEPQQPLSTDPYVFIPHSHFQARTHNPHMREAMFDGYMPDPTRHPHPIDRRHMRRQIAFHV